MKYNRKEFIKSLSLATIGTAGIGLLKPVSVFSKSKLGYTNKKTANLPAEKKNLKRFRPFDSDWKFLRDNAPGAETYQYDDAAWRIVELPHDWSIEDLPQPNKMPVMEVTEGSWRFHEGDAMAWKATALKDDDWQTVQLPANWSDHSNYHKKEAFGWYRKEIQIPARMQGEDFLLNLGRIADADETYFNGHLVGSTGGFPPHDSNFFWSVEPAYKTGRVYKVPSNLVNDDVNVIAVRVFNADGKGGIYDTAPTPRTIGPFSPDSPGGPATGHVLGGIGWYRKHFKVADDEKDKQFVLQFDGVYMNADIWINNHYLGNHPYGYTSFSYDISEHLRGPGLDNIIAVNVKNIGKNSRWYSGSGIYRHVWLRVTDKIHLLDDETFITSPQVSEDKAVINVVSALENKTDEVAKVKVQYRIIAPGGKDVATASGQKEIAASSTSDFSAKFNIGHPELWSDEQPSLYQLHMAVILNERTIDESYTDFGIRSIQFDAKKGFLLNGKQLLLKGGCMHHDNGPLGSAAIDRAEERRVELMKAQGFNAIRTSHNPPSTAFLNACDRLGMLVMDEAFDCWNKGKNPRDYHLYFEQWWERDIASMIKRDRNHPSVIIWSIGNEIPNRVDLSGLDIEKALAGKVKELDPTRPVAEAINGAKQWASTAQAFELLGVGGYNYQWKHYEPDHEAFPERIMVGTESVPKEAFENWQQVEQHPWVIGDFVWTGMDYLGESGIGHALIADQPDSFLMPWPWYVSYCGDIDICGNKKPQSYYRDVVWKRSQLEMAVHAPIPEGLSEQVSYWGWPDEQQSWNWKGSEGKQIQVNIYSTCPEVQLELNGKIIGRKAITANDKLTATFELPYQAGELKASALKDDKVMASRIFRTAGAPAAIKLNADRERIYADNNDLAYINVEVVDDQGLLVPDVEAIINFKINGNGKLAAVANGNPHEMYSFQQAHCKTFRGKCLIIIRPDARAGAINLEAAASGLKSAALVINTIKS